MRPFDDNAERWRVTQEQTSSLSVLRDAITQDPQSGPSVRGCRSVCWKAFLLFRRVPTSSCLPQLQRARATYDSQRAHLLRHIEHPEELAKLAIDPLADDPDSPWNSLRRDEALLDEIRQDVRRLPDEPLYHQEAVQALITSILFVYCKTHPRAGSYRQGMHELLAPIVMAVEQDAVDKAAAAPDPPDPDAAAAMVQMLDVDYVEHDSFAVFEGLMEPAAAFYDVGGDEDGQAGVIVEKSRFIHEELLMRVDPELANHLRDIEILPQIFLIRWIRLLFGREFPQDDVLVLWDKLFALDPLLDSVDLICVAMLLRIRWSLLEADYSVALQLLLRYPSPSPSDPPHTFVDDARFLRHNMSPTTASVIVHKYTGRAPPPREPPAPGSPPYSPPKVRSPLRPRLSQAGSVEALLQGAAKNVLERGERLGINQAVRDAMGELRRNMQTLQDAGFPPAAVAAWKGEVLTGGNAAQALAAMERRNRQLAATLSETIDSLRSVNAEDLSDKVKSLELIEMAAARMQFVKVYLEDSTMDVPASESPLVGQADEIVAAGGEMQPAATGLAPKPSTPVGTVDEVAVAATASATGDSMTDKTEAAAERPALIPTRSTLAQSSFSWMLEPDQSASAGLLAARPPARGSGMRQPKKHGRKQSLASSRGVNTASRERNAFLFGDEVAEGEIMAKTSEEVFGLEPIKARATTNTTNAG